MQEVGAKGSYSRISTRARQAVDFLWRLEIQCALVDVILAEATFETCACAVAFEANIHIQISARSIVQTRIRGTSRELILATENRICKVIEEN